MFIYIHILSLVLEPELRTPPEHLGSCYSIFSIMCSVFRSLFVLLFFFFWSLCYLSFCLLVIVLSVLLSFGHCAICPSVFWSLCYLSFCLLVIVLSVLLSFGHCAICPSVFWSLCYLSFCLLVIVLSVLLSFGHCAICPSTYGF